MTFSVLTFSLVFLSVIHYVRCSVVTLQFIDVFMFFIFFQENMFFMFFIMEMFPLSFFSYFCGARSFAEVHVHYGKLY